MLLAQQLFAEALHLNLVGGVVSRREVEEALGWRMDRKREAANKIALVQSKGNLVVPRTAVGSTAVAVASQIRTEAGEAPAVAVM